MNSRTLSVAIMLLPNVALAHFGDQINTGFVAGFSHPLTGVDHLAAIVAVGILGAMIGGRAIWQLPLTFMAMMMTGALLGVAGVPLLGVENVIVMSSIVLGSMIMLSFHPRIMTAIAVVGAFAVFHGYAHGVELLQADSKSPFIAGFTASTAALHLMGVSSTLAARRKQGLFRRSAGFIIAGIGVLTGAGFI